MAQRISRAKSRLRQVERSVRDPGRRGAAASGSRAAAHVLYLVFTEGHTSTTGPGLDDPVLAHEAIRLTRRLHALLPHEGEVSGLLALMLLTDARRSARMAGDGSLVPLAEQDRSLWNAQRIAEGTLLVEQALPSRAR